MGKDGFKKAGVELKIQAAVNKIDVSPAYLGWFFWLAPISAIKSDSPIYIKSALQARPSIKANCKSFQGPAHNPSPEFDFLANLAAGDNKY
jgi:hypothetical protein